MPAPWIYRTGETARIGDVVSLGHWPGVVVERNEVFNSGHACATIQGTNALFRWNVLHHCTMNTFDNAALYWYPNDWTRQNVTVAENFLYLNGFAATPCNFRTSCLRASANSANS